MGDMVPRKPTVYFDSASAGPRHGRHTVFAPVCPGTPATPEFDNPRPSPNTVRAFCFPGGRVLPRLKLVDDAENAARPPNDRQHLVFLYVRQVTVEGDDAVLNDDAKRWVGLRFEPLKV